MPDRAGGGPRMNRGREVLRELWAAGVRVELCGERFRLTPLGLAGDDLRDRLRAHRADVAAIVRQLPAPDRCQICGDPTGWNDGKLFANCTRCALVAAERVLAELG